MKTQETIKVQFKKNRDFIESLGFDVSVCKEHGRAISHKDSEVRHPCSEYVYYDFSATAMDAKSVMYMAIKKAYEAGKEAGKADLRIGLKTLLDI